MCGIFGILSASRVSLEDEAVSRLRDEMAHRGPDGAGVWRKDGCVLAHRRLKVVDVSEAAGQPMVTPDGRYAIVYNGELYNDAELRAELGVEFRTSSDTETILHAMAAWGAGAIGRLRGMYALGVYDTALRTLTLARDPLGIKPLCYRFGPTIDGESVIFASEVRPILAHPDVPVRPDWVTVSAYLTTIRTVLGERTLFEGVKAVRPGEVLQFEARGEEVAQRLLAREVSPARNSDDLSAERMRAVVSDSVMRHLRSDVPVCCLLSGGLDSSIVATVARPAFGDLTTYCSGNEGADDFAFASQMSALLGSRHVEAPVTRELFSSRWAEMVSRMGVPLSTPNEVAINQIGRRLREDGFVVALSGEGADELFAGYDRPMLDAARFEGLLPRDAERDSAWFRPGVLHGGDFQLAASAWIAAADKPAILSPDMWRACEHDDPLREFYREEFERASQGAGESPLQAHLRFHRRINLQGLLGRLDTALMLEGVEGRTPFADVAVCRFAESLPMEAKFGWRHEPREAGRGPDELIVETKRVLRAAFAECLPPEIVARKKASFPLPLEWAADNATVLRRSRFAREAFTMAAIEAVAARAPEYWQLTWPMVNIAMWGELWWG